MSHRSYYGHRYNTESGSTGSGAQFTPIFASGGQWGSCLTHLFYLSHIYTTAISWLVSVTVCLFVSYCLCLRQHCYGRIFFNRSWHTHFGSKKELIKLGPSTNQFFVQLVEVRLYSGMHRPRFLMFPYISTKCRPRDQIIATPADVTSYDGSAIVVDSYFASTPCVRFYCSSAQQCWPTILI